MKCSGCEKEFTPRYEGEIHCNGMACEGLHIEKVMSTFPKEFGLRNFPGQVFSISKSASYYSDAYGLLLYTAVKNNDGSWSAFAKGTENEIRREVVKLKG